MSWHLHGTILTEQGTAGNNRGDSEGNKAQLQRIFRNGEQHTTVSSEAIRYALREGLHDHEARDPIGECFIKLQNESEALDAELKQGTGKPTQKRGRKKQVAQEKSKPPSKEEEEKKQKDLEQKRARLHKLKEEMEELNSTRKTGAAIRLNRTMPDHKSNDWHDKRFLRWQDFFDDDVLGFMNAKEQTDSHRGILEISRAISTTPWRGEVISNYATPGSNPGVSHKDPIPYAIEVHHTRYQYTFTLTPEALAKDRFERTKWVLEGLVNLRRVGGNHAHFLFDFAPSAIVLRWTNDPAPRIMYCFDEDEYGALSLKRLRMRVQKSDISLDELWIGSVVDLADLPELPEARSSAIHGPKSIRDGLLPVIQTALSPDSGGNLA
jgi:CRISPR-associated protein Cst2